MVTIFDVAEKACVSVNTVSRLLNNPQVVSQQTADKINLIMDELNYQPSQVARSLVKKRTNIIGVIVPNIKNTFFNSFFRLVQDLSNTHNYNLILCNTDEDSNKEIKIIKLLQSQRVAGIMIAPCSVQSVEYLKNSSLPFVLIDRVPKKIRASFVTTDHCRGAFDLTKHLINLGHKKIAVLKGSGVLFPDVERFRGYTEAMKEYNLEVRKEFIINCEFDEIKAHKAVLGLLTRKEKPTAIFSFNGLMTFGAIKAIQSLDLRIPHNVSVVCFDEIPGYKIFNPKITHVIQPIEELGKEAVSILIEQIENKGTSKQVKIFRKPELVIGDSCRKI
jgi:LacI family transcriptional regulator